MRENLVFVSTASLAQCTPELFGPDREFDVVLHFYAQNSTHVYLEEGDTLFWNDGITHHRAHGREKLETAAVVIPKLRAYKQYAFLDDDLTINTGTINKLFRVGEALGLSLYQPALTRDSYGSHKHLFDMESAPGAFIPLIRRVPFIEIMCPFFRFAALELCLPTFDINVSGWGIDHYLWPQIVQGENYVIDRLTVGHFREPTRRQRIMRNGLTPQQELWIQRVIFDPATAPRDPPVYKTAALPA